MIRNHHSRVLNAEVTKIGKLIDDLSSNQDHFWPNKIWPAMHFDRPLQIGANGGHADIRYEVSAYTPSQRIEFRFKAPVGFVGTHRFFIEPIGANQCILHHFLDIQPRGIAKLTWLIIRPIHDALLEDALDNATRFSGREPRQPASWSAYVRLMRWIMRLLIR
ncbi:MAG: SRPBCC family protein [Pleurocapsa sp. SU_196_0]|nr:SRPBCC family protein [Pleurocapsa sp. SU_196_0]